MPEKVLNLVKRPELFMQALTICTQWMIYVTRWINSLVSPPKLITTTNSNWAIAIRWIWMQKLPRPFLPIK